MNVFRSVAAAALAALLPAASFAQTPVHWTVASAGTAAPGTTDSVRFSATIEPGWHIYALTQGPGGPVAMTVAVPAGQPFALGGTVVGPAPQARFDPNFGIEVAMYETEARFAAPVAVSASAEPGKTVILVHAHYQACNASVCLPARTEVLRVPVTIIGAKAKTGAPAAGTRKANGAG